MCILPTRKKEEEMMKDTPGFTEEGDLQYEKRRGGKIEHSARSRCAIAISEGAGTLSIRNRHYRFVQGDLIIMPEGGSYMLDCGTDTPITLILFRPYFLSERLRSAIKSATPIIRSEDAARAAAELSARLAAEIRRSDSLSADACRAYVAELCQADLLLNLSDIDGLYDSDPRTNPDAKLIERVENIDDSVYAIAGGAGTDRGTGGMIAKLKAAKMVTEQGIPMFILNGHDPEILYTLLDGGHVGTYFTAKK